MNLYNIGHVLTRYSLSFIWLLLLFMFSYQSLVSCLIMVDGEDVLLKLVEINKDIETLFLNLGVVIMLVIDNYITSIIFKTNNMKDRMTNNMWYLFAALVCIIVLKPIAEVNNEIITILRVPCIFALFMISLFMYKAKSLKISHISVDSDILPSKN